jgi:hypothetical protein
LGLFFLITEKQANAQFWKNWFKKKPEERGVLGGKDNLEERIRSRTLDDGEDAKPLVFGDSAASDKREVRKKKPKKKSLHQKADRAETVLRIFPLFKKRR